ncbi:MAG: hypothetical protein V1888_01430 [archaeon]
MNIRKIFSRLRNVYVRKVCDVDKFTAWFVDGEYIRTNIEEEFTNYGQHYRFSFIPENEFWIDHERELGEEKYYIDSMLVMNRLLKKGVSHDEAVRRADKMEKSERAKGVILAKGLGCLSKEKLLKRVRIKMIKKYCNNNLKVWIVDGELVRSLFFLDFTEGGHDKVYKFVPENEIWIDDDVKISERKFVLLHEVHERNLMLKGMCYNDAHRDSSRVEFFCRHNSEKSDLEIRKELEK